jgi:hypothetical protein
VAADGDVDKAVAILDAAFEAATRPAGVPAAERARGR